MGVPYGRLVPNMSKQTIPPPSLGASFDSPSWDWLGWFVDVYLEPAGDEGTNSFTPTKKGNFYWSPLIDGWVGACGYGRVWGCETILIRKFNPYVIAPPANHQLVTNTRSRGPHNTMAFGFTSAWFEFVATPTY